MKCPACANELTEKEVDGILVDVCHATCYDLNKVQEAYAGEFENQTDLHPALLRKVIETAARVRVARTSTE